jgi:flagellar protein FliO/FliZ
VENVFLALRVVVSLSAVLGVIWYAQRRLGRGKLLHKVVRDIRVVARQSLGSKASVVVVEADGKRLVLGVTDHSVTVLSESAAHHTPVAGGGFSAHLAGAEASRRAEFESSHASAGSMDLLFTSTEVWKRPRTALRRVSHK